MLTKLYLSYYIFFSLIIKQGIAYRHYYLTPLLTRNNVLCSAEVVQNQGKYFCDQDLNIRCVPGWRSEKSLCEFPICPEECNADKRQGKCILPSICACAVGWKGFSCNECIPRQGCARGYCENPGDCICHEHFSGPLCNQINVDESFIPFGVDQHQNQIMENHVKSDIISKEVLEESTSIRTMNDTSSNTANNSKNSSESEITFKQIIQNSVMNKNPKKIKSLQDTDLSIENSVLSMSESQSTNRSSFEDFTAPAKHRSKMILNSTAKIFESPPSMFDEVEEDTTTINELERNVKSSSSNQDSSEQISEQKVDVAPRFKSDEDSEKYLPVIGNMEMGPRFGGFYEDYSDFSIDQDTLAKLNAESSKTMENMMDRHKEMINGKSYSTKKTMEKNETSKENMPEVNESSENNRGVIGNRKSLLKGSDKETNEPQVMKRNLSSGDSLNNKINSTTRSILKSSSGESNSHSKNRGNTNESQTHNDPTFVDINRPHIREKEISHNYQRKNLTNSQNNVKNMSNHSSLTSRIQNKGSIDLNKIDGSYKNNDIDKKTAKKPTTSILKPERGIFIKPLNDTNSKNSRLKKNDLYMQTSTPKSDSMRQNERSNKILKDKLSHAKDKNGTMNQTYAGKTEHSKKNIAIIEESQIDSPSTSYKKMNNSIENIEGVLNNLSSVEQRTNHTYITSSDNVSYSINHSGLRKCRNRITDIGHPYNYDESVFHTNIREMISCDVHYPYYSLDGSCNSLGSPTRGMTFMPFRRVVKPMDMNEADAVFVKQFEMDGTLCMEHRASFKKQKLKYDPIVRNFAEFVSLDMVQTLGTVRNTGDTHDWDDDLLKNGECPSHYEEETLNRITSFIDGSQIYGTTFHVSSSLRKMENGLLHIPQEEVQSFHTQMEREQGMSVELFITLFKLEHNRLASQIKDAYKDYGVILGRKEDETIYQESRRIIIGVLQHIIYDKFLPVILGSDLFNRFELTTIKNTYYDRNLNPSIFNGFLTAFFDIFTEPCDNMTNSFSEDDLMSDINSIINLNKYPHLIAIFKDFNDDHGTYQSYKNLCGLANQTISNITLTELLDVFKGNKSSIDLFSGGFVEEPVQDGLIGPTFACIIAYQFHLAKAGDRHFYSNVRHGYPSHHNPHTDQTLIQSLQKPKPKKLKKSFIRQIEAKFYKDDPNFNYIRDSYRFNYDEVNEIRHRSLGGLFCDNGRISHTSQFSFYKKEGKWNHIIPCDSILPFNTRIFIDSSNANLIKKK